MAVNSYDGVAEKILTDLESVIKKDVSINEFDVIPMPEAENKNSSPILKGEGTVGLESWIVPHIYPYAHRKILQKSNYKLQNLEKLMPCLLGVALLNPDMPAAWSSRRELIRMRKLQIDNELRLTALALSRKPKCNEALAHRRWIITEYFLKNRLKTDLLVEELKLSEMIANRYHSNYHAWSHRMWSLQNLMPNNRGRCNKKFQRNLLDGTCPTDSVNIKACVFSESDSVSIVDSENFLIYSKELEENFKWVAAHVSDHSGLHYRKFLITEITDLFKYFFDVIGEVDLKAIENIDQSFQSQYKNFKYFLPFCSSKQTSILEFLKSYEFGNHYKKELQDYIENLEKRFTLFDTIMGIIISELKSNYSLCSVFSGHEALWYYRRFLIFFMKQNLEQYDSQKCLSNDLIRSHQDKNGVPYRKDFKYDDDFESACNYEIGVKHSDLYLIFYQRILKCEEDVIVTALNSADEHTIKLAKNYNNWLEQFRIKAN